MPNSYKFLFSEKNLEELTHDEICTVIKHVMDNMLKTNLNEEEREEELYNSLYLRLLGQCEYVGALIGMPTEEEEKEDDKKEPILYLFKRKGSTLKFLSFEDDQLILTDNFPVSLLFKKMIHLVESPNKDDLMKELNLSKFKIKQTFYLSFDWVPKEKDKIFSFIGTTLGQTWTFLIENKETFFLSPEVNTESGEIFWKKTRFVPLNFFFEKDFILFYEGEKKIRKDISNTILLQKKIFDMFSHYRPCKSLFNESEKITDVIQ